MVLTGGISLADSLQGRLAAVKGRLRRCCVSNALNPARNERAFITTIISSVSCLRPSVRRILHKKGPCGSWQSRKLPPSGMSWAYAEPEIQVVRRSSVPLRRNGTGTVLAGGWYMPDACAATAVHAAGWMAQRWWGQFAGRHSTLQQQPRQWSASAGCQGFLPSVPPPLLPSRAPCPRPLPLLSRQSAANQNHNHSNRAQHYSSACATCGGTGASHGPALRSVCDSCPAGKPICGQVVVRR